MRASRSFTAFALLLISSAIPSIQVHASSKSSSPFSTALEILQKEIGYSFERMSLLRRAMTHASFSEDHNKALSILGGSVIKATVAFQLLSKDIDVSPKELNHWISKLSDEESSCAVDGMRFGLHKVVRVSGKTNSSAPAVVCGAFRAIFGAIAVDAGKTHDAGDVFWNIHDDEIGDALPM